MRPRYRHIVQTIVHRRQHLQAAKFVFERFSEGASLPRDSYLRCKRDYIDYIW